MKAAEVFAKGFAISYTDLKKGVTHFSCSETEHYTFPWMEAPVTFPYLETDGFKGHLARIDTVRCAAKRLSL